MGGHTVNVLPSMDILCGVLHGGSAGETWNFKKRECGDINGEKICISVARERYVTMKDSFFKTNIAKERETLTVRENTQR